jgi:hypothetical protein
MHANISKARKAKPPGGKRAKRAEPRFTRMKKAERSLIRSTVCTTSGHGRDRTYAIISGCVRRIVHLVMAIRGSTRKRNLIGAVLRPSGMAFAHL